MRCLHFRICGSSLFVHHSSALVALGSDLDWLRHPSFPLSFSNRSGSIHLVTSLLDKFKTALGLLAVLYILAASAESSTVYDRTKFGIWRDFDYDCQNTRAEVLISGSIIPVIFKSGSNCQVIAGLWKSSYSGLSHDRASQLHIDHVVPLAWAWEHGASSWEQERLIQFGNDQDNLLPVEASLNSEKGALGPDRWLPPIGKCAYFELFEKVRNNYGLVLSKDEHRSFQIIGGICEPE